MIKTTNLKITKKAGDIVVHSLFYYFVLIIEEFLRFINHINDFYFLKKTNLLQMVLLHLCGKTATVNPV